jgi:hypothetical protein
VDKELDQFICSKLNISYRPLDIENLLLCRGLIQYPKSIINNHIIHWIDVNEGIELTYKLEDNNIIFF